MERISHLVRIFATIAVIVVVCFLIAQLIELTATDRASANISLIMFALRTAMTLCLLLLYIFVSSQLMVELRKFEVKCINKELRMIKWLQLIVGFSIALFSMSSLGLCFYYGGLDNQV
mmetsp:Transcript_37719/g.45896  ORF Transcript_37719/g.45896 Transcript_37719/m.45896 type:complete len:118 (+) Transcript_37719:478-831(+)